MKLELLSVKEWKAFVNIQAGCLVLAVAILALLHEHGHFWHGPIFIVVYSAILVCLSMCLLIHVIFWQRSQHKLIALFLPYSLLSISFLALVFHYC